MAVRPVPEGYQAVIPYFGVSDGPAFISFLKDAFGATEQQRHLSGGKIMHAEVRIGDCVVMLGDAAYYESPPVMHVLVYTENVDATYRKALDAGAESLREPVDQPYGDRSAGIKDPWGNTWWLATRIEDVSPEEIDRRMQAGAS